MKIVKRCIAENEAYRNELIQDSQVKDLELKVEKKQQDLERHRLKKIQKKEKANLVKQRDLYLQKEAEKIK